MPEHDGDVEPYTQARRRRWRIGTSGLVMGVMLGIGARTLLTRVAYLTPL
jgi:hypothetical protein